MHRTLGRSKTAIAKREPDAELTEALAEEFAERWRALEAAMAKETICAWECGFHLLEMQRTQSWRADPRWRGVESAMTFDVWLTTICGFARATAYRRIQFARDIKRTAIQENPQISQSHLFAVVEETAALPPGKREKARDAAIEKLKDKPNPTARDARKVAREAAGEEDTDEEAAPVHLSVPTVVISGEYRAQPRAEYLDPWQNNRVVKRPDTDSEGRPVIAGLRLRVYLESVDGGDALVVEVDLHRQPKPRLGDGQ